MKIMVVGVKGRTLVESENISPCWKLCHITLLSLVAIFGISGGVLLSLLSEEQIFCGTPRLFISPASVIQKPNVTINESYVILDIAASGKSDDACDFSQYTLICSFVFGTIWLGFFLMCGKGGKATTGLPQPWRIVLPAMIFTTTYTFIALGASIQVTVSSNLFCRLFDAEYARIRGESSESKCFDLDKFLPANHSFYLKIQSLMELAEVLTWLTMLLWGCSAGLCLIRMITGPDFRPVMSVEGEENKSSSFGYETLGNTPSLPDAVPGSSITTQAEVYSEPEDRMDLPAYENKKVQFQDEKRKVS